MRITASRIDIQRFESAFDPAPGADHDALAAAHGRALAQGAGELAGAIRSLRSAGPQAAGLSIEDDADPPASRGTRVAEGCTTVRPPRRDRLDPPADPPAI